MGQQFLHKPLKMRLFMCVVLLCIAVMHTDATDSQTSEVAFTMASTGKNVSFDSRSFLIDVCRLFHCVCLSLPVSLRLFVSMSLRLSV